MEVGNYIEEMSKIEKELFDKYEGLTPDVINISESVKGFVKGLLYLYSKREYKLKDIESVILSATNEVILENIMHKAFNIIEEECNDKIKTA